MNRDDFIQELFIKMANQIDLSRPQDGLFADESLKDPVGDRRMPVDQVPLPMQRPLQLHRVFKDNEIDTDLILEFFFKQGRLTKDLAFEILNRVRPVLAKEPNLLRLEGKVTIIGDVHG